jgi:outer membrane protein assembly factor BamB
MSAADSLAPAAVFPKAEKKPALTSSAPRLWPAAALAVVFWIAWSYGKFGTTNQFAQFMTMFWAPIVLTLGLIVWWLFFSRLPWVSRLWGVGSQVFCFLVAYLLSHKSVNWMGLMMYGLPISLSAAVVWLLSTGGARTLAGWAGLVVIGLVTLGYSDLIRIDGITGDLVAERSWRWTATAEDRFLAEQKKRQAAEKPAAAPAATVIAALVAEPGDWTDFRGPARDGHVRGVSISTDWKAQPPKELWRRLVGPGWSSFAVVGDRAFTQEQRGPDEAVVCIDVNTGDQVWDHVDKARFEEVVAGAGPRATPTFHDGKIYALGARGTLNCLDAATGKEIWRPRDILKDVGLKDPPAWGFSSSPLVVQGIVTVFGGGEAEKIDEKAKAKSAAEADSKAGEKTDKPPGKTKGVLAYDVATGDLKWSGGKGTHSYSSPQLATIEGVEQILMESDRGVEAFDPTTGKLLWEHEWYLQGMFRVCQPLVVEGQQVLIGTGMDSGTRLVTVAKEGDKWNVTENWTSKELKPYFNDFVAQGGHVYGFDGNIFTCLDLETGKRQWKKGRFGYGQALFVGDTGLALITSDTGELILAEATPQSLVERARIPALKGKTWNHPVLTSSGKLLLRNGEEMACYDLSAAAPPP